jgi:hypothetical protein
VKLADISGLKRGNIRKKKIIELATNSKNRNIGDLYVRNK